MPTNAAIDDFVSRSDLQPYGSNALLLYALQLKKRIEDIETIASQSLLDGPDDKNCDLLYLDHSTRTAIIAQGYFANSTRVAAPANKAAGLSNAMAWLLAADAADLPEHMKAAAVDLRAAVKDGNIENIEIWYVHNCPEPTNVDNELRSVVRATNHILTSLEAGNCNVRYSEVGLNTLETWYRETQASIVISDTFAINIPGGFEQRTRQWEAFTTAIPASWLFDVYSEYGVSLFSANVRDYLGSRGGDRNINNGIKTSAAKEPENFWVFNNGITALVRDYLVNNESSQITISGISIVNGAQTTGSIGSLNEPPDKTAMVSARFIKCSDPEVIRQIVRFNNSQNKIASADFRSTDNVQNRLRTEFDTDYPTITYLGGRRGAATDSIPRRQNLIPSDTAAQSLAAFHGRPVIAYNQKGEIWESNAEYSRIFGDQTHADHIVFVYLLHSTISNLKREYMERATPHQMFQLNSSEQEALRFLRFRGAIYLLLAAIGNCMELILDRRVEDRFALRFSREVGLINGVALWTPIVKCCIAFRSVLQKPLDTGLGIRSEAEVENSISQFKSLVEATKDSNSQIYRQFADRVQSSRR